MRAHFHNLLINLAVGMGAVSTLLGYALFAGLAWVGVGSYLTTARDPIFAWTVGALTAFYAVTAPFNVRMFSADGSACIILFAALLFAGALFHRLDTGESKATPTPIDSP